MRLIRLTLIAALVFGVCGAPIAPAGAAGDTIVFGSAVSLTGSLTQRRPSRPRGLRFLERLHQLARRDESRRQDRTRSTSSITTTSRIRNTAARLVERLIDQDHVNFILGPYGSGTSFTVAGIAERTKVPMVEGNGAAEKIFNQGYDTRSACSRRRNVSRGHPRNGADAEAAAARRSRSRASNDAFSFEVRQGVVDYANSTHMQSRLREQVSREPDRRSVGHQRDQGGKPGHHPQRRAISQDALLVQQRSQGPERQGEDLRLFGRTGHAGLRRNARQRRELRLRRSAVVRAVKYHGAPGFYRTAKEYADAFEKSTHHRPEYHNAESSAACLAFQYAIEKAGTLDPEKVRDALAEPRRRDVLRHPEVRQPRLQRVQADGRQPDPEREARDGVARRPGRGEADVSNPRLERALTGLTCSSSPRSRQRNLGRRDIGASGAGVQPGVGDHEHHQPRTRLVHHARRVSDLGALPARAHRSRSLRFRSRSSCCSSSGTCIQRFVINNVVRAPILATFLLTFGISLDHRTLAGPVLEGRRARRPGLVFAGRTSASAP